ncbi:hypothetical protein [Exiguobacterium sp. s7]|uniref:hypothetical protein n=1 Tax=Exiguobacterium sp. s7 TaxID=2751235 RepID=UPI001BEC1CE4|nr:hypothetical protein [Exiguobacterium sp. s7]
MAKYKKSIIRKIPTHYVEDQLTVNIGIGTVSVCFQNMTGSRVTNNQLFHIATLDKVTLHRSNMFQILISHEERFIEMEVRFNPDELKKKMRFGISESKHETSYKIQFRKKEHKEELVPQVLKRDMNITSIDIQIENIIQTFAETGRFTLIERELDDLLGKRKSLNKQKGRLNHFLILLQVIHYSGDTSFNTWVVKNFNVIRNLPDSHKEIHPIIYFRIIRFYFSCFSKQQYKRKFNQSSRIAAEQDAISFYGRMLGLKLPYRAVTPYGMLLKDWDRKEFNARMLDKILSYLQLTNRETVVIENIIQNTFYNKVPLQLNEKSELAAYGYIKVTSISMKKRREILVRKCIPELGLQRTVDLLFGISNLHKHQKNAHLVYTSDLQYLQRNFKDQNIKWPHIVIT